MRNSWLIKNHGFVFRRRDPTTEDIDFSIPYIWVNSDTLTAFIMTAAGVWTRRQADRTITAGGNTIYVIENEITIESGVVHDGENVLFGGEAALFGGEDVTW